MKRHEILLLIPNNLEVKALGVRMGTPWFQLRDLARKHNIVACSSNYTLYADMSNRLIEVLRMFSPQIEIYSIDESFLYLSGMNGLWPDMTALGQAIRSRVASWIGLPICVGFGTTKTLAKLANHIAKKRLEYGGVCDTSVLDAKALTALLASVEIGDVWGIGRRLDPNLRELNIASAQALRDAPANLLRKRFGVVVERTRIELNGESCIALEEISPARKQIVSSRSFGQCVADRADVEQAIAVFITRAAEKLRSQNSVCETVQVFVQTDPHRLDQAQYSNAINVPLSAPSADTRTLASAASWGVKRLWRSGYLYKKAGVALGDITPNSMLQASLFTAAPSRSDSLMATLDAINARFGRDTLKVCQSSGTDRWKTNFDYKTPRYTTAWEELPQAK